MNPLREIFAKFLVKFDDKELRRGVRSVDDASESLQDADGKAEGFGSKLSALAGPAGVAAAGMAAVAAAAAAVGKAVADATLDFAGQNNELDLNAKRLGVTTKQMQAMALMAADAGQDADAITDAMSTLQERMKDAVDDPKSDPAVQLRALGIAIPKSMEDMPDAITLLGMASDGLAGMSNQTGRVGASMTLFGDVGRELLPVLQRGSSTFEEYSAELERLGGGVSDKTIESSRNLTRAQGRLGIVMTSMKDKVLGPMIPVLEDLVLKFIDFMQNSRMGQQITKTLMEGVKLLGETFKTLAPAIVFTIAVLAELFRMTMDVVPFWTEMFTKAFDAIGTGLTASVKFWQDTLTSFFDWAAGAYNTFAEAVGLDTIQIASEGPARSTTRRGAMAAQVRATAGTTNNSQVSQQNTINITGNNPEEIGRQVRRHLDIQNRQAAEAVGL